MTDFKFPKQSNSNPRIYVYELPNSDDHKGFLKIGYTTRTTEERIHEQLSVLGNVEYKILLDEPAVKNDGTTFTDKDIHRYLDKQGKKNIKNEWYDCTLNDVENAIISIRYNKQYSPERIHDFSMRPEQQKAVEKTAHFFKNNKDELPHFLWNAKMRFGKTFTAYQLAKEMGWKKVLVLTFKPAVQSAWEEDLLTHKDFEDWQFISKDGNAIDSIDKKKPFVLFASLQDVLGRNSAGGIKVTNEEIHAINWDCVIFDEYHYGAWRENSKELFDDHVSTEDRKEIANFDLIEKNEKNIPITTDHYLYLSGTPFKAIEQGEFIESQIYNWTYSDEQQAKAEWNEKKDGKNPYKALPRMVLMTYDMPEDIKQVARDTEFNEFDLNAFFATDDKSEFIHKDYIQKWLDLIRGDLSATVDSKKAGAKTPPLPFSDTNLLSSLNHTFWFLPNIASCKAMAELLHEPQNTFYKDYKVIVCAGTGAGIGVNALEPVHEAMGDPTATKTITLSCGKLTTGVSVRPWGGIFMLRNLKSPETYFQSAFRVQTPWEIDGDNPNEKEIRKEQCYVFDFAPNRALKQISDYSCRLDINESNPEVKVKEFINFLPVLAYTDGQMIEVSAQGILDIAMSGTSATMLARRWESALLVNVDNMTLSRLLSNEKALNALMSIEGFRNLNNDIETIITKSEEIKNAKAKANEKDLTQKEKKELSEAEKEYKSKRKQIQEKLIKFATRIPIFMYLSDYREYSLKDVIEKCEPDLFKKVTGLTIEDFSLLDSLNLFNSGLMNDAVYKFKLYEDSSLTYTGIERQKNEKVGGWDTVITTEEHKELY
ncbi:MAG: DEAD/DEAH box helicase family protein [Alphaproteobacteria bacterium]